MRSIILGLIVFVSFMIFADDSEAYCENIAGKCTINGDGDFLECVCENRFNQDNWGLSEDNITVERCKERLAEVCGTELTTVDDACENKERMDVCYDVTFYVNPCIDGESYTVNQRNEAEGGAWNDYAKQVISCCYMLYWDDEYNGDNDKTELMESYVECIKENGATCKSCELSDSADNPGVDSSKDSESDESENSNEDSSSSGCSLVTI